MKRPLLQMIIVLFCLWHMFAVAVFAIPREARDSFSKSVLSVLLPVVTPYMYTTSQWQLWNLFAPDPLRLITLYRVEEKTLSGWNVADIIKPGSYPWWNHADYFKYAENVLANTSDQTHAAQQEFLKHECTALQVPPWAALRLSFYRTTIPVPPHPGSMDFWNTWTPEWEATIQTDYTCPPT